MFRGASNTVYQTQSNSEKKLYVVFGHESMDKQLRRFLLHDSWHATAVYTKSVRPCVRHIRCQNGVRLPSFCSASDSHTLLVLPRIKIRAAYNQRDHRIQVGMKKRYSTIVVLTISSKLLHV